jgi:hypothetical protein
MNPAAHALHYLVLDPFEKRSPALALLRLSQILHDRAGGRLDAPMRWAGSRLKPKIRLPAPTTMTEDAIAATVSSLHRRGWDILPWRLDPHAIAAMRAFAFSMPAYATELGERIAIAEGNIPREHGRYIWPISDLIGVPAIQKLVAESTLHRVAQDYLGCRPTLTSISLWLDPVFDKYFDSHVYHYDNDGPAFLKYFIYLTDVDLDSGAHTFEGSHRRRKPEDLRRSRRYDRTDLLTHYGAQSEMVFSAPAGTIIAEDTSGFHKGTTLQRGYRLLLQLQYAMLDIPHAEDFIGVDKARIAGIDAGIQRICRKYFA